MKIKIKEKENTKTVGFCIDCGLEITPEYQRCYNCNLQYKVDNDSQFKESEGEEFISEYLLDRGFIFKKQAVITNLKGDDKKFRKADFLLEDYQVYIEYDGYWHLDKERYQAKKIVYENNNIPCIYLYPENLGVLDFFLDKRLQQVLERHNMTDKLKKYYRYKFWESERNRFIGIGFLILLIGALLLLNDEKEGAGIYIFLSAIIVYQIFRIWTIYLAIFKHKKYPLYYIDF
ncbi:MAG: hypothetical protein EP305_05150 [Bacteroidetes bacterium]|nr:MAG: hypothetical protein EP305_05150 [Bacteroidota bacterium]